MALTAKNKKYLGIAIGILIALIMIYLIYTKMKSKPKEIDTAQAKNNGFQIEQPPPVKNDNFPLTIGSNGSNVKSLQVALNRINEKKFSSQYAPLIADGDFGVKTYNAVLLLAGTAYWTPSGVTQDKYTQILKISNNL